MNNDIATYNYDIQSWVTGKDAAKLIIKQTQDEIDTVRVRGDWYLRFIGCSLSVEAFIAAQERRRDEAIEYLYNH